jgi:hypothetical protein
MIGRGKLDLEIDVGPDIQLNAKIAGADCDPDAV